MAHNGLQVHARDELRISETLSVRVIQAAIAFAISFSVTAVIPLLVTALILRSDVITFVSAPSPACLTILAALASRTGGANMATRTTRAKVLGRAGDGRGRGCGVLFATIA